MAVVSAIFKSHFKCESLEQICFGNSLQSNFQPIPLTPEILEKCGFVMLHHLGKLQPTLQIDSSLEFHWLDDTLFVTYTQENYDENINLAALIIERPLRHIKYLHHLQNYIYFSTNVELAYKP
jgi:hypothetical protein